MKSMTESQPVHLRIPPAIREVVDAYCEQHHISRSLLLLRSVCREMGRLDLIDEIRPARRPRADESTPMKPPRKKK